MQLFYTESKKSCHSNIQSLRACICILFDAFSGIFRLFWASIKHFHLIPRLHHGGLLRHRYAHKLFHGVRGSYISQYHPIIQSHFRPLHKGRLPVWPDRYPTVPAEPAIQRLLERRLAAFDVHNSYFAPLQNTLLVKRSKIFSYAQEYL